MKPAETPCRSRRPSPLVVWRVVDGKPGHESQTQGLVEALARRCGVQSFDLSAMSGARGCLQWIFRRCDCAATLPDPDLVIGAGHRTHMTLLAAKRARGGHAVVLMRPSLPAGWFDLCLVPEHDRMADRANVVTTLGVLNTVKAAADASMDAGLILIGGPSGHFNWDTPSILEQVRSVIDANSGIRWTLTTSRRTPIETENALVAMASGNLEVVPCSETKRGWVAAQLERCGIAWVSEDSVSMVFEALTAGARVGLLRVPRKSKGSRVISAMDGLRERGRVVETTTAAGMEALRRSDPLAEADRCAKLLLETLHLDGEGSSGGTRSPD